MKTNGIFGRCWRLQHALNRVENDLKFGVVALFHFLDFSSELLVGCQHFAQLNKSAHDGDVHYHSALTAQDAGAHGHALFGKRVGEIARRARQNFRFVELKHKVRGKAIQISAYGPVETCGVYAVESRQVNVQQHPGVSEKIDVFRNQVGGN